MSQNKEDLPKTGTADSYRNKPLKGELFVRTKGGSVLLTQTKDLAGQKIDPRSGA